MGESMQSDFIRLVMSHLVSRESKGKMIKGKLQQVMANIIICAFPTTNYFSDILGIDNIGVLLGLLADIPIELDRRDSLTADQYEFKHFLSEQSAVIVNILRSMNETSAIPQWLECINAWCGFQRFKELSIPLIQTVISLIQSLDGDLYFDEAVHTVLWWLEAGIEGLEDLDKALLVSLLSLRSLFAGMVQDRSWDRLASMAKIYRLYGEIVAEKIIKLMEKSDNTLASEFLDTLLAFTQLEPHLSDPPVADVSHFWVAFNNALDSPSSKAMGWQYSIQVLQIIEGTLMTISPSQSSGYKESLQELIWTIYYTHGDSLFRLCHQVLSQSKEPSTFASWIMSATSSALRHPSELAWTCTKFMIEQWQLYPREDVIAVVGSIPRHPSAQQSIYGVAFDILIKCLATHPASSLSAMQVLLEYDQVGVCASQSVTQLVMQSSQLVDLLSVEFVGPFWHVVCRILKESPHTLGQLQSFLVDRVESNLDLKGITMLESYFTTVKPSLSSPGTNEMIRSACEATLNEEFIESACLLLLRIASDAKIASEPLFYNLVEGVMNRAISTLDPRLLKIIEAVAKTNNSSGSTIAPNLIHSAMAKMQRINRIEEQDDILLSIIPALIGCCRVETPSSIVMFTNTFLVPRLSSFAAADDLLRSIAKLVISTTLHSALNTDERLLLCQAILASIINHLSESQVDLMGPIILVLLQDESLAVSRLLEQQLSIRELPVERTVERKELIKKLLACRTPRKFTQLLQSIIKIK